MVSSRCGVATRTACSLPRSAKSRRVRTAADVGFGEGADAIWLAQRGWRVTASDVPSTALARASDHVANAGVRVQVHHGDPLDFALMNAQFDLVNVRYPALLHEQGPSLAALLALVAPGGTLLFKAYEERRWHVTAGVGAAKSST